MRPKRLLMSAFAVAVVIAGTAVATVRYAGADAHAAEAAPVAAPAGGASMVVRPTGTGAAGLAADLSCNINVNPPGYNLAMGWIEAVASVQCTGPVQHIAIYLDINHVWDFTEGVFASNDLNLAHGFDTTAHGVFAANVCKVDQRANLLFNSDARVIIRWGEGYLPFDDHRRSENVGIFC